MSLFGCCLGKVADVKILDYRHNGLAQVPSAVFEAERTIETLHIDANQIKVLPRELFHCHGLRSLTLSDNEITSVPAAIESLDNLEKLDLSKNGIVELPDNIKTLKYLTILDASVNPLGKLPDGFTQLLNLTQVCLNDCFLEYLPGNFGRLSKLKILELRENHLKTLPQSLSRLTELERLDIGCNEFTDLPGGVVGSLQNLLELWCDSNQITNVPKEIGNLKQLMYFDACKNRITTLPDEIDGCISLSDLHISTNLLKALPHSIGRLSNMTTLKVDDNELLLLPSSIGGLVSLTECDVSANDLEELPPTIGLLRHLRTLIADENFLADIPCELGSCSGLTVLSVRSNKLTYLPDEIGRIPRLRVLNLSDNEIKVLPYSLMNLKELQALWLAENQSKALIRLQSAIDPETERRCLTCYLLPQQRMDPIDSYGDDNQSFHPSLWEGQRQQRVQFQDTGHKGDPLQDASAYPKEMRIRTRHIQNEAIRRINSTEALDEAGAKKSEEDVLLVSAPSSPKTATHRLIKLEKEKVAKDKARINHHTPEVNAEQLRVSVSSQQRGHSSHCELRSSIKESNVTHSDHNMPASTSNHKLPQQFVSSSFTSQNKPKTIQNGHYHVANNSSWPVNDQRQSNSDLYNQRANNQAAHNSQHSLRGQPYDRYLSSQLQLYDSDRVDSNGRSRLSLASDGAPRTSRAPRTSANRINHASSQAIHNQEDTFGIFTSDEDPKLYQRRFKYYQRMRKHRKNPEVKSDLGYYHGQYNGGSVKPASDSGHRHRRPLQQGHDGFDQWERYSQRSVGDGYASDLEAIGMGGKRMHHVSNHIQAAYRPTQRSVHNSRGNVSDGRPAVPPSYSTAVANKSATRANESVSFPPPPPYKPPARDPGPDGASNDGVPRSSPSLETGDRENVPFKSYTTENKLQEAAATVIHVGATPTINSFNAPPSRLPTTSTPVLPPNQLVAAGVTDGLTNGNAILNQTPSNHYTPTDGMRVDGYHQTSSARSAIADPNLYRPSFTYDSTVDTEYAAQISRSLGRLGYNRESDKGPTRPPSQFSGTPNDTVPPPALFSSSHNEGQSNRHRNSAKELYGSVGKKQGEALLAGSGNYATPASYSSSVTPRRPYQTSTSSQNLRLSNGHPPASNTKHTSNYSYLPPPTRKSPKLPHKQVIPAGLEVEQASSGKIMNVSIVKNPGLGFSVAGGVGLQGNPYRPLDEGIFVTKLTSNGAAIDKLQPGDKILTVNGIDLTHMEHNAAVTLLKQQPAHVSMTIERTLPTDV